MNLAAANYYLTSSHKKAREFRNNLNYKKILKFALVGVFKTDDIYQKTDVAANKKERGRVIGTLIKNLIQWGFLVKTGEIDKLYRQETFSLNEALRERIINFIEQSDNDSK